jgi:hypothetical protein
MTYLQLNKQDEWKIKDWITSDFWRLINDYLKDRKEELQAGILSWVSEDRSKTIYNKRDMDLKELEVIDDILTIPQYLLTRISNQTDISVEDDH